MVAQNGLSRILEKIHEIAEKSASGNYIYRGEPKHYKKVSSTLYRQYEADIEAKHFDIEVAQNEMLTEAKDYIHETSEEFEILTQLQHFGGKTNLIDFTIDYLIAFFFACDGLFDKPGRVILLGERAQKENRVKRPLNIINRVRDQKSVFARPPKGFIEPSEKDIVTIPADLKKPMLEHLKKYHGISTNTIYNDLHGFIRVQDRHQSAYTEFFKGLTCQYRKQHDTAIEHYTEALKLNPQLVEAYNNRGINYEDKGDFERAIADYTRAIELNPDYADAYNNRGNICNNKGDFERAIADYTRAIELDPDFADTCLNRGLAHYKRGDVERAIADYTRAIELNPNDGEAHNNRGLAHYKRGEVERAIADYTRAIELDPDFADTCLNRGLAHYKRGDVEHAIADYTRAIELNPNYTNAYYNRGKARLHQREWAEARLDLRTAVEKGMDIVKVFRKEHGSVHGFQQKTGITLPEDIVEMLSSSENT